MGYFEDVYLNRLNRDGETTQERIKTRREREFEAFLAKSIYKVQTTINDKDFIGSLEPNKQDEKATTGFFLVPNGSNLNSGLIFYEPQDRNDWLIIYRTDNFARGYEKYLVAKANSHIEWLNPDKKSFSSKCYMFGQLTRIIEDRFRNFKGDPAYREDIKVAHVIMPFTENITKDSYLIIQNEAYLVSGFDIISVPGVMYITITATFKQNLDPIPEIIEKDKDTFWFQGVPSV